MEPHVESPVESRVKHVFDGLSLVAVGLVFLGMTLGIIEWSVLLNVISLWPLLIVAAGVDLVGKSLDSGWVRALSSLVFIGGLAYAVFLMPADGWPGTLGIDFGRGQAVEFSGRTDTAVAADEASLDVGAGAGSLEIGAGSSDALMTYDGRSRLGEPRLDVSEEGSSAVISLDFEDKPAFFFGSSSSRMSVDLNPDAAWSLKVESGVGDLDADFGKLDVARVVLESGVGNGKIRLGDPVEGSEVRMQSGIASMRLLIPADAEARVRFESGIGSKDLPEEFERTGDGTYETPGYDGGEPAWNVLVQSGIGSIDIETY